MHIGYFWHYAFLSLIIKEFMTLHDSIQCAWNRFWQLRILKVSVRGESEVVWCAHCRSDGYSNRTTKKIALLIPYWGKYKFDWMRTLKKIPEASSNQRGSNTSSNLNWKNSGTFLSWYKRFNQPRIYGWFKTLYQIGRI